MKDDVIKKFQDIEKSINEKMEKKNINVKILNLDYNFGLIIIKKENRIDKVFKIEAVGQYQIKITENNNVLEYGLFLDDIGKWIYNLYNPVKYLCSFVGGKYSGKTFEEKEVYNKPIIDGYLGPMFDGIDYGIVNLRYETQQEYDLLSH